MQIPKSFSVCVGGLYIILLQKTLIFKQIQQTLIYLKYSGYQK